MAITDRAKISGVNMCDWRCGNIGSEKRRKP